MVLRKVQDGHGVIILEHPGVISIPAEIDHLLKDRASWEEHYLPRLQWSEDRVNYERLRKAEGNSA
jgi:hypothetical protein